MTSPPLLGVNASSPCASESRAVAPAGPLPAGSGPRLARPTACVLVITVASGVGRAGGPRLVSRTTTTPAAASAAASPAVPNTQARGALLRWCRAPRCGPVIPNQYLDRKGVGRHAAALSYRTST